ncbi:hypothetical protein [Serratia microhaemolytica]|uniref:hypothetical protein n=1 Tax=Serratia microhaemolytica TaxID=2675110 RepID=UPI000FDCE051|nr:hypothetical protein [Serratia microhaemolytica]
MFTNQLRRPSDIAFFQRLFRCFQRLASGVADDREHADSGSEKVERVFRFGKALNIAYPPPWIG